VESTAIFYAAYNDRVEVVRYLATHGTDGDAIHEVLGMFRMRPERRDLWKLLRREMKKAPDRAENGSPD
jgi:hypothetical protein